MKSAAAWTAYCKSGKKPADIPAGPRAVYANDGWAGWSDWLGTGRVAHGGHRSFKNAREFVHGLRLKSEGEWRRYLKSGKKPPDIPAGPRAIYANDGWVGWGDWLGTGRVAHGGQRSFKEARAFVRRLGLKSSKDWLDYCKSGKRPGDIPANPYKTYAEAGWVGMGDWRGTGRVVYAGQRSFKEARAFVRRLGLRSNKEWLDYCKSGKRPGDIPYNPQRTYAEASWVGWGDWLGTGKR